MRQNAHDAKNSPAGHAVAVVGLGSRAIVYGSLTVLVLQVAFADRRSNTDQGSALATLGKSVAGSVLLVALIVGVACYVLWRWSEAWLGPADGDESTSNRVQAFVEGAAYLPFAYLASSVLAGDPGRANQGKQYRTLSGRILQTGIGQALIAAVGAGVVVAGGFFVWQGVKRSFESHFDFPNRQPWVRPTVLMLGSIGSIGRGLIFIEAGVLVVYAALSVEPGKAGGLDAALDTLSRQSYGTVLLLLAAAGFAAFTLFALAEAGWRDR